MDLEAAVNLQDIPVQPVRLPEFAGTGSELSILRLDLVHARVSGNKWFKLMPNLRQARQAGQDVLLSFGGPWSNHLHALAAAGKEFGFRTIGVVRGELPQPLNPCLRDAVDAGMQLHAVSRQQYARKHTPAFLAGLATSFGDFYLVPEGGANRAGINGCAAIVSRYQEPAFDLVCLACGTGATLAGMATRSSLPLLGFQVLKGAGYLQREIEGHFREHGLAATCDWQVNDSYHFGGYGKVNRQLLAFTENFENLHGIPLEPVYAGKALFGLLDLQKRDIFPRNKRILFIHGGGLQGARGFS